MNKKQYQSPTVKVVEFKVEKGFEGSNSNGSFNKSGSQFEMSLDENQRARNSEAFGYTQETSFWN